MSNIVKPYQALPSLHSADHPPLPAGASSANLGFQHDSAEDAADELAHCCWVSIALVLLEYNLVNLIQIFDVLILQGMGFLGLPYLQDPFNSWGSRSIYHL